jgi:hypothetical protein
MRLRSLPYSGPSGLGEQRWPVLASVFLSGENVSDGSTKPYVALGTNPLLPWFGLFHEASVMDASGCSVPIGSNITLPPRAFCHILKKLCLSVTA